MCARCLNYWLVEEISLVSSIDPKGALLLYSHALGRIRVLGIGKDRVV